MGPSHLLITILFTTTVVLTQSLNLRKIHKSDDDATNAVLSKFKKESRGFVRDAQKESVRPFFIFYKILISLSHISLHNQSYILDLSIYICGYDSHYLRQHTRSHSQNH